MYATHQVHRSLNDPRNYTCFIQQPFDFDKLLHVLIFFDDKDLTKKVAQYLDDQLPTQHRGRGIVRHYHSGMSEEYLKQVHTSFVSEAGLCRILVATSGQSMVSYIYFDHQCITEARLGCWSSKHEDSMHCQASINYCQCTQKGRSCPSRVWGFSNLCCILWGMGSERRWKGIHQRCTWSWPPTKRPLCFFLTCRKGTTLRNSACTMQDLLTPLLCHLSQWYITQRSLFIVFLFYLLAAFDFITPFCCDHCDHDGETFKLEDFLPGYLFQGAISATTSEPKVVNRYCPTWERHELDLQLIAWVEHQHSQDPYSAFCAPYDILSQAQRDTLVLTQFLAITSTSSITEILNESSEWGKEWAEKIYTVICNYQTVQPPKPHKNIWIAFLWYDTAVFRVNCM